MKVTSEIKQVEGHRFIITSFESENGEDLNDTMIRSIMKQANLRPVMQTEFGILRQIIGKPETRLVAFGNKSHGPRDTGSFPGVPYLDTDGEIKVEEDWTRGNMGDQWHGKWKFVFVPVGY